MKNKYYIENSLFFIRFITVPTEFTIKQLIKQQEEILLLN